MLQNNLQPALGGPGEIGVQSDHADGAWVSPLTGSNFPISYMYIAPPPGSASRAKSAGITQFLAAEPTPL
jgi:hypothetical protein